MGNSASADTQRYLDGYPGEPDDKSQTKNVDFYSNKRPSKPDGDLIENIHKKWWGNYGLLEAHHGYIQWLFPIREDGLNHHAQRLQLHEAKSIASDPILQGRIITSYELMLDFYGMKLVDRKTGAIERGDNWKSRYAHLNRSFHNYLRITRILKCLGEVGLEHFKIHFVKHVLKEIYENRELLNCHESCLKYWSVVLRSEDERNQIKEMIGHHEEARVTRHTRSPSSSDEEGRRGPRVLAGSNPLSSSEEAKFESENKTSQKRSVENSPTQSEGDEEEQKATEENMDDKSSEDEDKKQE